MRLRLSAEWYLGLAVCLFVIGLSMLAQGIVILLRPTILLSEAVHGTSVIGALVILGAIGAFVGSLTMLLMARRVRRR